jgi:hypothetical protein
MRGQSIRPSQFILTYGVGAIIDTREGPNAILDFQNWGQMFTHPSTSRALSDFEIRDDNVTALLGGGRIFAIPTNADLEKPEDQPIYRTGLFPHWGKCEQHDILYPITPNGSTTCPNCPPGKYAQTEAIRFVRACYGGHLDDIDWPRIVHRKSKGCSGKHFRWIETTSGDLRSVKIQCTTCNDEATLWDIYNQTWHCSGYSPESDETEKCDREAIVVLRSASNLRIPEVISALTIPPKCTQLHHVLSLPTVQVILTMHADADKARLLSILKQIASSNPELIKQETIDTVEEHTEAEVEAAIKDCKKPADPKLTPDSLKEKEIDALKYAAVHGYPPNPKRQEDFEVEKGSSVNIDYSSKLKIRVTPIKRLRIVMAQRGFKRLVRPKSIPVEKFVPRLVEKFYFDIHDRWFPGIALRGEGVFVDLSPNESLHLNEEIAKTWFSEFLRSGKQTSYHPVFVFWHTFAHRAIQALGLDSGYSSAAIRERIYLKLDKDGVSGDGGFLLYTSQPGGDGSLGGLIALAKEFGIVLETAFRNIDACSNDPLCAEQVLTSGRANGAACYACLFLSETSCEYRNTFLDRNLLRESI